MKLKIDMKYVAVGQLLLGALLISLQFLLPYIEVVTDEYSKLPSLLNSLNAGLANHDQQVRAAEILEMQNGSLDAVGEASVSIFYGLLVCGLFMIFTGLSIILQIRRKSNESNTT